MPTCTCGFDYVKARLAGREFDSYAVIYDADYRRVLKKELAILSEKDKEKKQRRLATASQWVGGLMHCPECGAWLLLEPVNQSEDTEVIILKRTAPSRSKMCPPDHLKRVSEARLPVALPCKSRRDNRK
ncbi:MAG: hypothetical protein IT364_19720 [Candidatus Hydrogenedentes bacterium]|nr:hypothetical protein [Candidatus Hydrogenedentota bacterium]